MFKKMMFAIAPMMLIAGSVVADDDLLSALAKMDVDQSMVSGADIADAKLGQADVDALLGDDDASSEDAIAACYRRFRGGYGRHYSSYGSYGHRHYGSSYTTWHNPCHTSYRTYTHCYTPVYCPPTYSYYTPSYTSYWGCH
ncbi:hypothetical protein K227x_51310 [Rubripirellula lacrimiformis]|uniref:Uncharacterized protein n=1 Tax=Rubripirellula lacrimiformis TaxID=1930273 RepID=A0A517NHV5_9BACT|nr:hypothetical protein [Rubripirellula lacrimiformis]QDT06715.1 hypothetical protein K227x_51310 [Rubripirellula lacrimiformis]